MKEELIKYQTENITLSDAVKSNEAEIQQLSSSNKTLNEKLELSDEYINELKATLNSEKNFNMKVADNLAHQTQETSKLKQLEKDFAKQISDLHTKIEQLDHTIEAKGKQIVLGNKFELFQESNLILNNR